MIYSNSSISDDEINPNIQVNKKFEKELSNSPARKRKRVKENSRMDHSHRKLYEADWFIGKSVGVQYLWSRLEKASHNQDNLLLVGPSGSGKQKAAEFIHYQAFKHKPFVDVNMASLHEDLFLSELFGYEKGAFTGANHSFVGKVNLAQDGVLFLDEISEISLVNQAKLLKFLEQRSFYPLGSNRLEHFDGKIILATNCDLFSLVNEGTFRADLYYRLVNTPIIMPALASIKTDILDLFYYFLRKYSKGTHFDPNLVLSEESKNILLDYSWPGNIREMSQFVYRLVQSEDGKLIDSQDIVSHLLLSLQGVFHHSSLEGMRMNRPHSRKNIHSILSNPVDSISTTHEQQDVSAVKLTNSPQPLYQDLYHDLYERHLPLKDVLQEVEKNLLILYHENHYSISELSRILMVDKSSLYRKFKKYTID